MKFCEACKSGFLVRKADSDFYDKFDFPEPKECPDCRLKARLRFRNERNLYKRISDYDGKEILSIYDQSSEYKICQANYFWEQDAKKYSQEIDFSKSFFEQFQELRLKVPRIALLNVKSENSDYCQQAYQNKSCYLSFVIKGCESCYYTTHSHTLKDCFDCSHIQNSELCYECLDSDQLYSCFHTNNSRNSNNLYFCNDCIGCHFCISSSGLRNKSYYFHNKYIGKEKFQTLLDTLNFKLFSNISSFYSENHKLPLKLKSHNNSNIQDCVGNYLLDSKNCYECFDSFSIEDSAYSTWMFNCKDSYEIYGMGDSELVYNAIGAEKLYNSAFCLFCSDSSDVFYSDLCFNSSDLFGCVGLNQSKYCIFNKQYTKEQYLLLKTQIIEHMKKTSEWGRFFPEKLSPFSYTDSIANEYFPVHLKNEVVFTKEKLFFNDLDKVSIEILKETLSCISCSKKYKIQKAELEFSKQNNFALSPYCTDCRYQNRILRRNQRKQNKVSCADCRISLASYSNSSFVYCDSCYLKYLD